MQYIPSKQRIRDFLRNPWVVTLSFGLGVVFYYHGHLGIPNKGPSVDQLVIYAIAASIYVNSKTFSPVLTGLLLGITVVHISATEILTLVSVVLQLILLYIYKEPQPAIRTDEPESH